MGKVRHNDPQCPGTNDVGCVNGVIRTSCNCPKCPRALEIYVGTCVCVCHKRREFETATAWPAPGEPLTGEFYD